MATRPITVRGGGLTGLHYGLFAFVGLTLVFLVLFIMQLTQNKDLLTDRNRVATQLSTMGNFKPYYTEEALNRSSTVGAVVDDEIAKMGTLVAGQPDALAPTLEAQATTLLTRVAASQTGTVNAKDTLLTAIDALDKAATDQRQKATAAQEQVDKLTTEVASLTQQLKATRDTFEGEVKSLGEQLTKTEEEKTTSLQAKDTQLSELQANLDAITQQLQTLKREGNASVRDMEIEIARRDKQIGELQKKLQEVKGNTFDPNAILTRADARIMRSDPGSEVVYINLGSNDKAKVGMGFEVFSKSREPTRSLRGKASIEIVTIMCDTAECRITRGTPGQPVLEGDYVVNVAFERGRKPKFVVRGDFDLNYDGVIDFDGVDKIRGMINEWGGQVVPELDESVDYVIVGLAPGQLNVREGASDVIIDQAQQKALESSRFRELIDRARSMYIPVITQNQFLYLSGNAGNQSMTPH